MKLLTVKFASVLFLGSLLVQPVAAADCVEGEISVHCGEAPSATFDADGNLWVAFVQDMHVYVSRSTDKGASFETSVKVNPEPEDAEFNGENRPKIIVDGDLVYVSWTQKTSPRFTGEIRFARSTDGGATFAAPRTINDDGLATGHRFESLFLTESGHLYLTWIDKRDLEAKVEAGGEYAGAAVYYAVSTDEGATFSRNHRVSNHSCECCRIAMAPHGADNVAVLWRQIFGETTRDHAIAVLTPNGEMTEMHRASYDEWQINACPHHGPSMIQGNGTDDYHLSWFTNGDRHQGIYYARFSFADNQPHDVYQVDANPGAGHPYLATFEDNLYLVWKGFDGQQSVIRMIESGDDGRSWSEPRVLASTGQGSDHPLVVTANDSLYLSWKSEELGYVFQQITGEAGREASD